MKSVEGCNGNNVSARRRPTLVFMGFMSVWQHNVQIDNYYHIIRVLKTMYLIFTPNNQKQYEDTLCLPQSTSMTNTRTQITNLNTLSPPAANFDLISQINLQGLIVVQKTHFIISKRLKTISIKLATNPLTGWNQLIQGGLIGSLLTGLAGMLGIGTRREKKEREGKGFTLLGELRYGCGVAFEYRKRVGTRKLCDKYTNLLKRGWGAICLSSTVPNSDVKMLVWAIELPKEPYINRFSFNMSASDIIEAVSRLDDINCPEVSSASIKTSDNSPGIAGLKLTQAQVHLALGSTGEHEPYNGMNANALKNDICYQEHPDDKAGCDKIMLRNVRKRGDCALGHKHKCGVETNSQNDIR
ncbi:hypothetical protein CHS0354_034642 [Potamilus streckersoni]|uniref:Uncharacterized protein n=1 Tax=Potamilus streckersoni TaxID=2493646 RepID=A0AAE0TCX0_9BIVA|nr:hypothetical protein CHS0354_034642 [Potamilus streckersoni]